MPITAPNNPKQLTLEFDAGLAARHRNLRDCVATCIYQKGLTVVATALDESPGNLTNQLGDQSTRKFGVDDLEKFMNDFKDFTPIYYLIDKSLHDKSRKQEEALAALAPILQQLAPLMRQAGLTA